MDVVDSQANMATTYQMACSEIDSVVISLTFAGSESILHTVYGPDLNLGKTTADATQCQFAIFGEVSPLIRFLQNDSDALCRVPIGMDTMGVGTELIGILGDVFMKGQYSVFSFDSGPGGAPAVGFAPISRATLDANSKQAPSPNTNLLDGVLGAIP